eukprot:snap_masked-scaffold_15-processed-gene-4.22-mRNA-1 protein AED:1.00 eAED:1.00 QI:0/-1/0/0/-1/1/1/0/124
MSKEENLELLQRGQDYKTWRIRIKAKLMEEGLFKTIENQKEKYEASTTRKITLSSTEQKRNGKAMAIILRKISNNMLEKVEACEDIYSMWEKLKLAKISTACGKSWRTYSRLMTERREGEVLRY